MQIQTPFESLLRVYCPHGVQHFYLGELEDTEKITLGRGKVISKQDIIDTPGTYPVYSSSAVGDGEIGCYGKFMFDDVRLSWSIDGGGKFFYRNAPRYSITNVSGWLKVNDDTSVNIKYLYYTLLNEWVKKSFDYTHKAHPSVVRKEYRIPLPPLPVQQEIVRILDSFTELTAELTARRKQYEYYRDELLNSNSHNVSFVPLGELYPNIRNGFVGTVTPFFSTKDNGILYLRGTNIHDGSISTEDIVYVSKDFHKKHSKTELKTDDIIMVQSGHVGECAVVGEKYAGANCHALIVMSNGGKCNSEYITHYLHSSEGKKILNAITTGGTVKHILASKIKQVVVPLPTLDVQNRIVKLLNNFNVICTDLNTGLPAEIAARQKQYEYYRDKLLTFKETL